MIRKRLQLALLFGLLLEAALAAPLIVVSPHLDDHLPLWVDVLRWFQIPGAPVALWLMHWAMLQHLAARFQVAPEIRLAAEALSIVIQVVLFALIALGVLCVIPPRGGKQTATSSA